VTLSPALEAQAHALGRAIADKIVAYVMQQGWVNKADLPEAPVAAKPQAKKLEKLPAAVARQGGAASTKHASLQRIHEKSARELGRQGAGHPKSRNS
jgi:hypothetical protein